MSTSDDGATRDPAPPGARGPQPDGPAGAETVASRTVTSEAVTSETMTSETVTPENLTAESDEMAVDVQEDLDLLSRAMRERDDYLDDLRRLQADFENYKKRMIKQQTEHVERAAGSLVEKLLPVLDTADLALLHGGGEEVKQVSTALFDALGREGLERIDAGGAPFDPTVHDAVAHEPVDGIGTPEVAEVLRAGYRWKGRVLRPAMVKVRG